MEFVDRVEVKLIDVLASDNDVAMAAWVSHDADNEERLDNQKQVKGLINFLYKNRHMSPFEHGIYKFKVDVPLFVAREWHRHRTQSYNEVSGRYTEMTPRFYVPPRERPLIQNGKPGDYYFTEGTDEQYAVVRRTIEKHSEAAWDSYQDMLANGVAKEVARDVLPLNLMTQFYATMNPRNLMQFLSLRDDSHALWEIRQAAKQCTGYLKQHQPYTYEAYKKNREVWEAFMAWEEEKPVVYNMNITVPNATDTAEAVQRSFERRDRRVKL